MLAKVVPLLTFAPTRAGEHLHQEFALRRVNQVNLRREFFRVAPAQVRDALGRFAGQHLLELHETPEALEWYASDRPAA